MLKFKKSICRNILPPNSCIYTEGCRMIVYNIYPIKNVSNKHKNKKRVIEIIKLLNLDRQLLTTVDSQILTEYKDYLLRTVA